MTNLELFKEMHKYVWDAASETLEICPYYLINDVDMPINMENGEWHHRKEEKRVTFKQKFKDFVGEYKIDATGKTEKKDLRRILCLGPEEEGSNYDSAEAYFADKGESIFPGVILERIWLFEEVGGSQVDYCSCDKHYSENRKPNHLEVSYLEGKGKGKKYLAGDKETVYNKYKKYLGEEAFGEATKILDDLYLMSIKQLNENLGLNIPEESLRQRLLDGKEVKLIAEYRGNVMSEGIRKMKKENPGGGNVYSFSEELLRQLVPGAAGKLIEYSNKNLAIKK